MADFNSDVIMHGDLTDQQITDLAVRIELDAKEKAGAFDKYFESRPWPAGKVAVQFRTLVHTPLKLSEMDNFELKEITAPTGQDLTYATFSFATKDYGTKYKYSWKDVAYNADDVISDARSELGQWRDEERNLILGSALLTSKSTLTFPTGTYSASNGTLMNVMRKVDQIFRKLKVKPLEGASFDCLTTSEIIDLFTEEYSAKNNGQAIPEMDKEKAMQGYVTSYKHFNLRDPACDEVMKHVTSDVVDYHYMVFIGRTPRGGLPGVKYELEEGGIGIIHNPLGSGLLKDKQGNYTSDDNHQLGSIAINMKGFSGHVIDDRAILVVQVPVAVAESAFSKTADMANVKQTLADVVAGKTVANGSPAEPTTSTSPKI